MKCVGGKGSKKKGVAEPGYPMRKNGYNHILIKWGKQGTRHPMTRRQARGVYGEKDADYLAS